MPLLEQNIYALWAGKQVAKGTALAAPTKRLIQVAGDFTGGRDDGAERYSDLGKYGSQTDWVNSLLGSGEPGIEATPEELAWLLWGFHGAETVSAIASSGSGPTLLPASSRRLFVPSLGLGHPLTFWVRVGQSVVRRHVYRDCYITRVQLEGSTANKALRITPRILSLDPAEAFTADPTTPNLPTDKPFLYTDTKANAGAAFTIDTFTFNGQSQFTMVIDDAWDVTFGDDTTPFDFIQGTPVVTIGVTLHFDANALSEWNRLFYGTAAPAAGTKPLKNIPALGSYAFTMKGRDSAGVQTGRGLDITIPGVKWTVPDAPAPAPEGGGAEIALAGAMRPTTAFVPGTGYATQPYTIGVNIASGVAAFT